MGFASFLDKRFYPGIDSHWSAKAYREFAQHYLRPTDHVLDFGAGRGAEPMHSFHGTVARVVGADVDSAVMENPHVDDAVVIDAFGRIDAPDRSFDAVVSAYVLEHLPDPARSFTEIARVLRPGGMFVFLTPNRFHYVPLIASATPHSFHVLVNKFRGRNEEDTFPTLYRANSRGRINALAARSGFSVVEVREVEQRPEYLRHFGLLYPLGIAYERLVNAAPALWAFRVTLLGALRKSA